MAEPSAASRDAALSSRPTDPDPTEPERVAGLLAQLGRARDEIGQLRVDAQIKDGVIAELRAASVVIAAAAVPVRAARRQDELDDLNRVCRLLMAEWERVERRPVGMSFVSTFVDLARVAISDRERVMRERLEL